MSDNVTMGGLPVVSPLRLFGGKFRQEERDAVSTCAMPVPCPPSLLACLLLVRPAGLWLCLASPRTGPSCLLPCLPLCRLSKVNSPNAPQQGGPNPSTSFSSKGYPSLNPGRGRGYDTTKNNEDTGEAPQWTLENGKCNVVIKHDDTSQYVS